MIFDELIGKVNSIVNRFDDLMVEAMMEEEASIIDLNVSQLEHGIGGDGTNVGEYDSEAYAQLKQAMGSKAPRGIVDTKLTGEFHEGIFVEPFDSTLGPSLFISSKDWKTDKLEDKYNNMWGIAPENSGLIQEVWIEKIQNKILNEIT